MLRVEVNSLAAAGGECGPRKRAEKAAATRSALIRAARSHFGADGYPAVNIANIVSSAGVSLGALYYNFPSKSALFLSVLDQVEAELAEHVTHAVSASAVSDSYAALCGAVDALLAAYADPGIRQILLVDRLAVLRAGPSEQRRCIRVMVATLEQAMAGGFIPSRPAIPMGHLLVAAVEAGALYIAGAASDETAHQDVASVLHGVVRSFGC